MLHASPFLLWQIFHNKGRKWGWKAKTGPRLEREGITAIHVALDSQSPEVTVVRKLALPTRIRINHRSYNPLPVAGQDTTRIMGGSE